jgi:hypothetical protein
LTFQTIKKHHPQWCFFVLGGFTNCLKGKEKTALAEITMTDILTKAILFPNKITDF